MFGTSVNETRCFISIMIWNIDKLRMVFNRMNTSGNTPLVPRVNLLSTDGDLGICKVICNEEKTCMFRYHKTTCRLSVHLYYGHWNIHGIPQHH